jgi:transposase
VLVRLASELVRDIRAHTVRINELHKELSELVTPLAPRLLELPGCGVLTAAKLIGEVDQVSRFRSESCFTMHAGVAPIPASSGKTTRDRLARGGNRQLNAALHRIALNQIRLGGPGSVYYQRRRCNGDTTMEAIRALKRRLARVVYGLLRTVESERHRRRGGLNPRGLLALHPVDLASPDRTVAGLQPSHMKHPHPGRPARPARAALDLLRRPT